MGSLRYTTNNTASEILTKELCGKGVKIRIFTTDSEAACVALAVDLSEAPADYVAYLRTIYDLDATATHAYPAVIVKGSGIRGRGSRIIETKIIDEIMFPYYTGGANAQLMALLSPLLAKHATSHAGEWRDSVRKAAA